MNSNNNKTFLFILFAEFETAQVKYPHILKIEKRTFIVRDDDGGNEIFVSSVNAEQKVSNVPDAQSWSFLNKYEDEEVIKRALLTAPKREDSL